jgi:hypothetical protein
MKRRREEAKTRIRKRKKKRYIVSNIHVIGETTIHIYIYIYTHIKYEIRITRKEAKRRRRTEGNNQYNRGRETATIKEEETKHEGRANRAPQARSVTSLAALQNGGGT